MERILLWPTGHVTMPAWAPPFPARTAATETEPPPPTPQLPPAPRRQRIGPSRLIALVEASPTGAEQLAAALAIAGQASGRTTVAVALEPEQRLRPLLTEEGVTLLAPPLDNPESLTRLIADLQRQADLLVVDLGCRWAPTLFRPILSRADEIWLVGQVGQWGALESRQAQAEFSGWTNLERISLVALGPPGTGSQVRPGEPITLLESTEPSLRSFADSYWGRQPG